MEIFGTFGLDPIIIVAQIVNFLIILYILKRFLYKPLFNILKKREDLVKESLQKTEESSKALEKAQEEEKKIIKKAQETADQIVTDAKDQSAEILAKAKETTKQQTDKMLADARTQIEQETKTAEKQLDAYVTKLSVELLRKSLENVFTEKEQNVIIQRAMESMHKS